MYGKHGVLPDPSWVKGTNPSAPEVPHVVIQNIVIFHKEISEEQIFEWSYYVTDWDEGKSNKATQVQREYSISFHVQQVWVTFKQKSTKL